MKKLCFYFYKFFILIFFSLVVITSVKSQSKLWGINNEPGGDHFGSFYGLSTTGSNFEEHNLVGVSVFSPVGELVLCPNGKSYGIASSGGQYNVGAIYEYD